MIVWRVRRRLLMLLVLGFMAGTAAAATPLFDAHLHYGGDDARHFSPAEVMAIFDRNDVRYALISSTPNDGTEALYRHAPERIIPFLGVYRTLADKRDWMHDPGVIERLERNLGSGIYRGIGEFHIFASDRNSPVLCRIVEIAAERGLMLQVHGDAEIIDTVFEIAPQVTVLWAHMGTRPEPDFLRQVLARHPERLYIDTSVRDGRIMPDDAILPEWRDLFIDHAERFLVGVDTFSVNRWQHFDEVAAHIRAWLEQLPPDVARKLAYDNAARLFGVGRAKPAEQ